MQKIKKYFFPTLLTILAIAVCIIAIPYRIRFAEVFPENEIWWVCTLFLCVLSACIAWLNTFAPAQDKYEKFVAIASFFLVPFFMECAVELLNSNMLWDIDLFGNIVMNYLCNLLIYIIFLIITGRIRISLFAGTAVLSVFGIVNMYVKLYKGSPLLPWDLSAITTAKNVASAFSYEINPQLLFALSFILLSIAVSSLPPKQKPGKLMQILRIILAFGFAGYYYVFYHTDFVPSTLRATPDFFNQTRGYEAKGAIAEFFVNTRYLTLEKPGGYDVGTIEEEVNDIISSGTQTIVETTLQHQGYTDDEIAEMRDVESVDSPNIIVIMNEAFSDLSVIGDFDTNTDYMPFINSLKDAENVISGYSYVSTIGTGTSNTEYEFLTGNSMAFLPMGSNAYQLYVDHTQPSLVSSLLSQNYSTTAFHPYYKKNWNRISVYENMGFESYIGIEDLDYYQKLRRFVSDEYDFAKIKELYAERDTSKPFFLFNITMQNHSSYDQTADFIQQITLENMEKDYPLTEQYLSLIKETDDAFAELISYFNTVEEPTIILLYGDHQPFIEDSFYEEVMGKSLSKLSDEENQKRYITRFVLWANYDIPEAWIDEISVNYLSVLLSQTAGLQTTTYQDFLSKVYEDVPVVTMMGCRDWNQQWFTYDDVTDYYGILNLYARVAYNNLIEDTDRIEPLFYLKEEETP